MRSLSTYLKPYAVVLLLYLLLAACTAPIDLRTNDAPPVIVIYGVLTDALSFQEVTVYRSSPYFANEPNAPVRNASVRITSDEDHVYELVEDVEDYGHYRTLEPMSARSGVTYHLEVSVDFDGDGVLDIYEASTTVPAPFAIDSVGVRAVTMMGMKLYSLLLYADEPVGEDYYLMRYIINDTLTQRRLTDLSIFSDRGINGQRLDGISLTYLEDADNESNFDNDDDAEQAARRRARRVQSGDRITLCLSRIEGGYHDFITQCDSEKEGENPIFGGPPSNITTNIIGGGVGYFTSYPITMLDVTIP